MKRSGCPRLKIKLKKALKKECGQTGWCIGLFFVLFVMILILTQMQVEQYRNLSLYLEDALAASNLASAIIDVEQYGINHEIVLSDPVQAYENCCMAVKGNLNLDDNWEHSDKDVICGKVELKNYIIYNVRDKLVNSCRVNEKHEVFYEEGILGEVYTPGHVLVEGTGIYSEIIFPTKGLFGVKVNAHKGKLVDIRRREEDG